MSVKVYWDYFYKDPALEAEIVRDEADLNLNYGLTEIPLPRVINSSGRGFSRYTNSVLKTDFTTNSLPPIENCISYSSRFVIEWWSNIYRNLISFLEKRCWLHNQVHAEFRGEEYSAPTLVVRKWMLDLPLSEEVKDRTDTVAVSPGNHWDLVNGLYASKFREIGSADDYKERVAWDIYRYQIFEALVADEFEPEIVVVEDYLPNAFWSKVRKRVKAAEKVEVVCQNDGRTYLARSTSKEYLVNTRVLYCSCPDLIHRSWHQGMHCKHLIAALKQEGIWEQYWQVP